MAKTIAPDMSSKKGQKVTEKKFKEKVGLSKKTFAEQVSENRGYKVHKPKK